MVEWKTIEEIGSYFGGLTGKTKADFEDGNAHFITYMNVFSNPSLDPSVVGVVKINEGEKQNKVQKGDVLFTGSSETPEETGMSCVVTDDLEGDFYMNSFCFGLRLFTPEQYNLHFLKHLLRSEFVRKSIAKTASGVTRFNISKARFSRIQIPIPSLSEQTRIVGILDTFTASIDNLKEQIAQRRKQYEYYRDQLLDLEGKEGVEMIMLGYVCKIGDGLHGTPIYNENGDYFFINGNNLFNGKIILKSDTKKVNEEMFVKHGIELDSQSILMSINGTIGNIAFYNDEKIVLGKSAAYFKIEKKDILDFKYLYYYLQTTTANYYFNESLTGSTIKNLGLKALRNFEIPLPSLSEQSRIVSILDTFESSIQNLEAQLKEREKQYEYYRNKLLTFE